jgi:hypothetical protein
MNLLRSLLIFLLGIISGLVYVGAVSSFSYPYSEFPIIPILVSLALVLRVRPSAFWFLFSVVFILDLYRGAGFGVGILSFVALIIVGNRVSSDVFSHRSLIGCLVISAAMGLFWVLFNAIFGQLAIWFYGGSFQIGFSSLLASIAIQSGAAAVIVGALYSLAPRWLRDHSPMIINGRI